MACETDRMSDEGYGAADVEGEIEVEYVRFIFDCCSYSVRQAMWAEMLQTGFVLKVNISIPIASLLFKP